MRDGVVAGDGHDGLAHLVNVHLDVVLSSQLDVQVVERTLGGNDAVIHVDAAWRCRRLLRPLCVEATIADNTDLQNGQKKERADRR